MQGKLRKLLLNIKLGESMMQIVDSSYYVIHRRTGDVYEIDKTHGCWKTATFSINQVHYETFKELVNNLNFK